MISTTPEWLSMLQTTTFLCMLVGVIYNRMVSWKKFNERTMKLETAFEQYQKDIGHYLQICELCRGEVRKHHEDNEVHVGSVLLDRINELAKEVSDIKNLLIQRGAR